MKTIALLFLAASTAACELPVNGLEVVPAVDVAVNPVMAHDAGVIPETEATTPLLFGSDAGLNSPSAEPDCHAPAMTYYEGFPTTWCTQGWVDPASGKVVSAVDVASYATEPNDGDAIFLALDPAHGYCGLSSAPSACSSCDYTCDCLLKHLCLAGTNCTCEQAMPGGIILFGPVVLQ